jgi:two-component system, response regulator / RNA-binding antiterminator
MLQASYNISASLPVDLYLPERIAKLQPDMIIIEAESDTRDVLEHVVVASRDARRPIVLFTEDEKPPAWRPQWLSLCLYRSWIACCRAKAC